MQTAARLAGFALAAAAALAALAGGPAPAADAQTPPATFYGRGLEAGDIVTASIGGAECGRSTADATGGWSIIIQPAACGGAAVDGAAVTFALNGRAATPAGTWRTNGLPDDVERGITLTPVATATFHGGGLEEGDVVTASIGGAGGAAGCGAATAGADGEWAIVVAEGGCGGAAVDGATVSFAVNGAADEQTATWRAGVSVALELVPPPRKLLATFYGGGLEAGHVVTASIGGVPCGEAAADASGAWSILVAEGECGGGAAPGAAVSFAVNGRAASPAATWEAGGPGEGITLTVAGMTLGLRGASALYVLDTDGVFAIYVVGAPDFLNAPFAERWIVASGTDATPPTLTLGIEEASAVYVLDADGVFTIHVVGAPDFLNARFAERWIVGAP